MNANSSISFVLSFPPNETANFSKRDIRLLTDIQLDNISSLLPLYKYLNLSDNSIAEMDADFIMQFVNVCYINISQNKITKIQGIESLKNLKYLDVSNNEIALIESFGDCNETLERIYAFHNNIHSIFLTSPMNKLEFLDVRDNQISKIDFGKFVPHLHTLKIDNNKNLSDISELSNFEELEFFSASSNQISEIPKLTKFTLKTLNLSNNKIKSLTSLNQKKLKTLDVSANPINDDGINCQIEVNKNLRNLFISSTEITRCYCLAKAFPNLTTVELSRTKLNDLNDLLSFVHEMKNLKVLNVRDTPLTQDLYPEADLLTSANSFLKRDSLSQQQNKRYDSIVFYNQQFPENSEKRLRFRALILKSMVSRLQSLDLIKVSSDEFPEIEVINEIEEEEEVSDDNESYKLDDNAGGEEESTKIKNGQISSEYDLKNEYQIQINQQAESKDSTETPIQNESENLIEEVKNSFHNNSINYIDADSENASSNDDIEKEYTSSGNENENDNYGNESDSESDKEIIRSFIKFSQNQNDTSPSNSLKESINNNSLNSHHIHNQFTINTQPFSENPHLYNFLTRNSSESNEIVHSIDSNEISHSNEISYSINSNEVSNSNEISYSIHSNQINNSINSNKMNQVNYSNNSNKVSHSTNSNKMSHSTNSNKMSHLSNSNKVSHLSNSNKMSHSTNSNKMSHLSNSNKVSHLSNSNKVSHLSNSNKMSHLSNSNKMSHAVNSSEILHSINFKNVNSEVDEEEEEEDDEEEDDVLITTQIITQTLNSTNDRANIDKHVEKIKSSVQNEIDSICSERKKRHDAKMKKIKKLKKENEKLEKEIEKYKLKRLARDAARKEKEEAENPGKNESKSKQKTSSHSHHSVHSKTEISHHHHSNKNSVTSRSNSKSPEKNSIGSHHHSNSNTNSKSVKKNSSTSHHHRHSNSSTKITIKKLSGSHHHSNSSANSETSKKSSSSFHSNSNSNSNSNSYIVKTKKKSISIQESEVNPKNYSNDDVLDSGNIDINRISKSSKSKNDSFQEYPHVIKLIDGLLAENDQLGGKIAASVKQPYNSTPSSPNFNQNTNSTNVKPFTISSSQKVSKNSKSSSHRHSSSNKSTNLYVSSNEHRKKSKSIQILSDSISHMNLPFVTREYAEQKIIQSLKSNISLPLNEDSDELKFLLLWLVKGLPLSPNNIKLDLKDISMARNLSVYSFNLTIKAIDKNKNFNKFFESTKQLKNLQLLMLFNLSNNDADEDYYLSMKNISDSRLNLDLLFNFDYDLIPQDAEFFKNLNYFFKGMPPNFCVTVCAVDLGSPVMLMNAKAKPNKHKQEKYALRGFDSICYEKNGHQRYILFDKSRAVPVYTLLFSTI